MVRERLPAAVLTIWSLRDELITQPQIVDETGDLLIRATAIGFAGDHVREGWRASEVDPFAQPPTFVFGCFRNREVLCRNVQRFGIMRVDDEPIGPPDRRNLNFGHLDGTQMHTRL